MIEGIQLESWGAEEEMGRCLSYTPPRVELAAIFLVILQATKGPAAAVHVLFTPPLPLLYYCFTTALLLVSEVEATRLRAAAVLVCCMLRSLARCWRARMLCCRLR